MPLYRLSTPSGSLALVQRAQIAEAITEIHCEVTGAPALFVHVFFFDAPASGAGPRHQVHGTIRAGRTPKQVQDDPAVIEAYLGVPDENDPIPRPASAPRIDAPEAKA